MKNITPAQLELVKEVKISELLRGSTDERHEASGVHFKDGFLHIVFDNDPCIARLGVDLSPAAQEHVLIRQRGEGVGYEDLTFQPLERHWYCLIEASEYAPGVFKARVEEFDEGFQFIKSHWLDFPIKNPNKGIEGLSYLNYRGENYLLGLCEGNACKSGALGREPGKGRILLFKRSDRQWEYLGKIKLPKNVLFEDYAGLDVRGGNIAVVSQASSALWVGKIRPDPPSLSEVFDGDGYIFQFPRDAKGRIVYCNIEGVTWVGDGSVVVVSDRAKPESQPSRCAHKDQSVHIFQLPDDFHLAGS